MVDLSFQDFVPAVLFQVFESDALSFYVPVVMPGVFRSLGAKRSAKNRQLPRLCVHAKLALGIQGHPKW